MFDFSQWGRFLVAAGLIVAVIGLFLIFAGKIPFLGRLPGDLFFRWRDGSFYFPLTTSILVSVAVSLILWLINRP